jgi:predicted nuclease of predicted toxin-antitoxin system
LKVRFLVDEDCPLSLEKLLNSRGYDTIHVKTSGLSGTKDPELFIFAQEQQRIIISRDLGWANIKNYPPNSHCGLIILRFPFEAIAMEIRQVVEQFIDLVNISEIVGATVIVDKNKFRIRKSVIADD